MYLFIALSLCVCACERDAKNTNSCEEVGELGSIVVKHKETNPSLSPVAFFLCFAFDKSLVARLLLFFGDEMSY